MVVDDGSKVISSLREDLVLNKFKFITVAGNEKVVSASTICFPTVVILHYAMSCQDELINLESLRHHLDRRDSAILLISERQSENDLIETLSVGADDYIKFPYLIAEFTARIRSHFRRLRPLSFGKTLIFNDLQIDSEACRVTRDGHFIHLGPVEFRLIGAFLERPDKVWTRDALINRVWGHEATISDRTVDVKIAHLRKALCKFGHTDPIRTIRGNGYSIS